MDAGRLSWREDGKFAGRRAPDHPARRGWQEASCTCHPLWPGAGQLNADLYGGINNTNLM